jgi:hypothetical protein
MGVGNGLPHDLAQYVIEAATGTDNGFWGCVAKGATFRSTSRRRTRPGRAVIAEHRRELDAAEELAGRHLSAWGSGKQTPVTEALDTAMAQWRQLRADERLVFVWPQCRGEIRPLDDR